MNTRVARRLAGADGLDANRRTIRRRENEEEAGGSQEQQSGGSQQLTPQKDNDSVNLCWYNTLAYRQTFNNSLTPE